MDRETVEQLNFLKSQAEQLQQQLSTFAKLAEENEAAKLALTAIPDLSKETLFPLGAGVYLKGKATVNDKVLVEVGGRVLTEKTLEEAKKILEERGKQVENAFKETKMQYEETVDAYQDLASKANNEKPE